MNKIRRHCLILIFALALSIPLIAQNEPHHPELKWKTIETQHFVFHFHPGTEWSVQMAIQVAESVYPNVTGLYNWEPAEKTHIIIQDTDDYANGGAYYFDNKIMIWASPLEFDLRGNHQWMWNVFTHEFSHIVSLGASMKYPINIPMFYVQWKDREIPMKENIILEYPKGIGSLPIANSIVPMWWAEGVAQYQYENAGHDSWDSHRDMILRDAALNNRIMSWSDVSHFGHPGIGNEVVYNTGYAFARYLADRFGSGVHADIARAARKKLNLSFNKVLKDVTGISGKELYNDFADKYIAEALNNTATIRDHLNEGESFFDKGPGNFLASYSPDGNRMVFESSVGYDYISYNFLYTFDEKGKEKQISKNRVRGNVAWSPDSKKVYFAQRQKADIYGSTWFDLMEYDFENKKLNRLTEDARIYSVAADPKGHMYVIRVYDGTHNIFSYDPESKAMVNLTNFSNGEQVFIMQADPSGSYLYFDMAVNHGRDIYRLDLSDNSVEALIFDPEYDNRTPYLSPDGKTLYYSSDRTGIFNIYKTGFNDLKPELVTNVTGAAMYPAINPRDGSMVYTLFKEGRFILNKLDNTDSMPGKFAKYKDYSFPTIMQDCNASCNISEARDYDFEFSKLFFEPFLQYDYDAMKGGLILFQNEVLDKMNLFAMADVNHRGDYDINARLDFNQFLPRFYFEVFSVGLNRQDTVLYNDYWRMEQDIRFSLTEATLGVHYTWRNFHYFELSATTGSYTSFITGDIPEEYGLIKFVPATYYKGQRIEFRYRADFTKRHWQSNISPTRGWRINDLVLAYDLNKFIDDYRVTDYGTHVETYTNHYTPRIDLDADFFIPVPGTKHSALSFNADIGMMFNTEIDSFFNYFGGGLPGLKGYPFYAIEGTHKAILTSTLRFPISKKLGLNMEPFFFENLYISMYHQIGDAWTFGRSAPDWKQDIGIEARIAGHSWYGFPLALTFDLVYALDVIEYQEYDVTKTIGHNFRFYWTLLFDF
jgi:Tol biopolymer transport system component